MFHVKHVARGDGRGIDRAHAELCTSGLSQPTVCGCRSRDPRQGGLQWSMSLRRANDDLQADAPDASGLRDGAAVRRPRHPRRSSPSTHPTVGKLSCKNGVSRETFGTCRLVTG